MVLPSLPSPGQDPWFSARNDFDEAVRDRLDGDLSPEQLSTTIVSEALSARNGHKNVFLAGVIRNSGAGWEVLPIGTNHRPVNIDSVETLTDGDGVNGFIRVHYELLGAETTVGFIAVPDETLASHGFLMGTSVTETRTDIRLSQAARAASDYVYFDGADWVSYDGVFSALAFDAGVLTLTHGAHTIPLAAQYDLSVTPRGPGYEYGISQNSSPTGVISLAVEIRDDAPEYADYVYWDSTNSVWVSQNGVFTFSYNSGTGDLTLTHPALPAGGSQHRVSVGGRGTYPARLSATSGAATMDFTTLKIQWFDPATGAVLTGAPTSNMRAAVRHGGGSGALVTTPTTGMKMYVSHGGGTRRVHPADVTTDLYPSSNIWLFGVMEMPD